MGKSNPGRDDLMSGVWEWAAEINSSTRTGVLISLDPTSRAGVFLVTVYAMEVVDGKKKGVRVKVWQEWPGSERLTLPGTILRLTAKLDKLLGDDPLRQQQG